MSTRDETPKPRGLVWFSLLGAPLAWMVQELTGWLLLTSVCSGPEAQSSMLRSILLAVSACGILVALGGMVAGLHLYRLHMHEWPHELTGHERPAFMAGMGLLVSAVFLLALVWATLPLFTLPLCEATR